MNEHNKEKWSEDHRQSGDNLELIPQKGENQDGEEQKGLGFERTAKNLEGYHEDIIFMIQNAQSTSQRGTGAGNTPSGSGSISEELLRKALQECSAAALNYGEYKRGGSKSSSKENICDTMQPHSIMVENGPSTSMMHSQHRPHAMHQQSHMQQSQQQPDDDIGKCENHGFYPQDLQCKAKCNSKRRIFKAAYLSVRFIFKIMIFSSYVKWWSITYKKHRRPYKTIRASYN